VAESTDRYRRGMKAKARHDLRQNDFAEAAARVVTAVRERPNQILGVIVGAVLVVALLAGFLYWRKHSADASGALLGIAMAQAEAQIAPASTLPGAQQASGTFPTVQARSEAALKSFQAVVDQYPSSNAALVARYQIGAQLLSLGKYPEAEQAFKSVRDSSAPALYQSMAKLGLAQTLLAEGKNDDAIKAFTDLAADRDGPLPVDGILMQLAEADAKAGKTADARAAFKRVVDEFPESTYVSDARQRMAAME